MGLSVAVCAVSFCCSCAPAPKTGGKTDTPEPSEPVLTGIEYTVDETMASGSLDGNAERFFASNVKRVQDHPLAGKTVYWLGSSVTYGASSEGEAMAEFLAAKTGAVCRKDAVSGTTIFDDGLKPETGSNSYTRRLTQSTVFRKKEHVDAFICQISTNDALASRLPKRGQISDGSVTDKAEFDRATTLGGVEYIIAYVKETWGCPVYFYSGCYFGDEGSGVRANKDPSGTNYAQLVSQVTEIAAKWRKLDCDVGVIDPYNDEDFNGQVTDAYYKWCTKDPIHPKRAGYLNWWTPYFERYLTVKLCENK